MHGQYPGFKHLKNQGTDLNLDHTHISSVREDTTGTLLTQEGKTRSPPTPPAYQLLLVNNRKPPDLLLHGVVLQLHSTGQEEPAAGGESSRAYNREDHYPLLKTFKLADSKRRPAVLLRTPFTPDITCSPPTTLKKVVCSVDLETCNCFEMNQSDFLDLFK